MNTQPNQAAEATTRKARKCIIFGARVRNQNPKTQTCDPICTRAKHSKRTRSEQAYYEGKIEDRMRDGEQYAPKHCAICAQPIDFEATSCESCGGTDFDN